MMAKRHRLEDLGRIYHMLEGIEEEYGDLAQEVSSKHCWEEFAKKYHPDSKDYDNEQHFYTLFCRLKKLFYEINEIKCIAMGDIDD